MPGRFPTLLFSYRPGVRTGTPDATLPRHRGDRAPSLSRLVPVPAEKPFEIRQACLPARTQSPDPSTTGSRAMIGWWREPEKKSLLDLYPDTSKPPPGFPKPRELALIRPPCATRAPRQCNGPHSDRPCPAPDGRPVRPGPAARTFHIDEPLRDHFRAPNNKLPDPGRP